MVNLLRVYMELVSLDEMVIEDDADEIDCFSGDIAEDAEDPCERAELPSDRLE